MSSHNCRPSTTWRQRELTSQYQNPKRICSQKVHLTTKIHHLTFGKLNGGAINETRYDVQDFRPYYAISCVDIPWLQCPRRSCSQKLQMKDMMDRRTDGEAWVQLIVSIWVHRLGTKKKSFLNSLVLVHFAKISKNGKKICNSYRLAPA